MKIVIFDTNAWLDLYMIHPLALKEIILKFKKRKELFWIPEQVYWEFSNHSKQKRECALDAIKIVSASAREKTAQTSDQIKKDLVHLKNNVILSDERIINEIEKKFDEIRRQIKHELEALNNEYQKGMGIITEEQDIIYKFINEVYKANPPYHLTEVQRMDLYEEGELRIKYNIPPGLTDIDKEDSNENVIYRRRYGDFLIWKDVLRKTEELTRNLKDEEVLSVIFVENEKKGDWWISRGKPTIAPVLREEFELVANGKAEIEMVNFTDFLTKCCNEFEIGTTTVKSLVEKNKYKEKVISEIDDTAKEILERVLLKYYLSPTKYEKLFNNKSYLGGSFSSVKDFKLEIKEIENVRIDEDGQGLCLSAKIKFEYSGEVTECISNEHNETETVKDLCSVILRVELSIDYSQGYDTNHYDIGKVYVQGFQGIKVFQGIKRHLVKKLRDKVFERDEYTCRMCGKSILQGAMLCVDSIIPMSLGGTNDLNNLQTLCLQCNQRKRNSIM